jgi:hypothetical protein
VREDRLLRSIDRRLQPYAAALIQVARMKNPNVYITSGRRSAKEQLQLFVRFQEGRSRYPAAPPGSSKHERGLAFDLGGMTQPQLRTLGKLWERWGGRWGGRFKDSIHFESNP